VAADGGHFLVGELTRLVSAREFTAMAQTQTQVTGMACSVA
jgi:hypothetical protein